MPDSVCTAHNPDSRFECTFPGPPEPVLPLMASMLAMAGNCAAWVKLSIMFQAELLCEGP